MSTLPRRLFLGTPAAAAFAYAAIDDPEAKGVTKALANYVVNARREDVPAAVRKEAVRTLLNWVGCAVGGSRHETLDCAIAALAPFSGPPQAAVLGRKERLDALHATLMNGISSHVFDFDDTHLKTIIHPAGPVAPAILALAEYQPVSGPDFLHALILGAEVECRIGAAVYPEHYDAGWHITGSVGPFGAAAAVGKLLKLNEQQMSWALGLAAVQPVGLREMFGTMTKELPSRPRSAEWLHRRIARVEELHVVHAGDRSAPRLGQRPQQPPTVRWNHVESWTDVRNLSKYLQAVPLRDCHSSVDRWKPPTARAAQDRRGANRARRFARASSGAGIDRQERAASCARRKVQRLSRSGCGTGSRPRRRAGVFRRGRA